MGCGQLRQAPLHLWRINTRTDGMNNQDVVIKRSRKELGASMVEYALLVSLIAVVAIVAVRTLGQSISQQFSSANSAISGN